MVRIRSWYAILLLLPACEHEPSRVREAPTHVVSDVILSVVNRSDRSVHVSLEAGTTDYALGMVAGRTSRSFSLPSEVGLHPTGLRLKAERQRDRTIRSVPFAINAGEQVEWTYPDENDRGVVKRE